MGFDCIAMSITQNKGDGFEIVYYEVGREYINSALRQANGNRDKFHTLLLGACAYRPLPLQGEFEVMSIEECPDKPQIMGIHLKLKRGHWQFSEFSHAHQSHGDAIEVRLAGQQWIMSCRKCKTEVKVLTSSLPKLPWSLLPIKGIHDRED